VQGKPQITESGKKRVASDDFAKTLVHVLASGKSIEQGFDMAYLYTAANLAVDEHGFVECRADEELCIFAQENDELIRETIRTVVASPIFMLHALDYDAGLCRGSK
jgi:hypothetical protein